MDVWIGNKGFTMAVTPTPHPPCASAPKKGYPGTGRLGVNIETVNAVIILSRKMMILQGVGHPISYLRVCCANNPKMWWYMAPAPMLDPTTSL